MNMPFMVESFNIMMNKFICIVMITDLISRVKHAKDIKLIIKILLENR